MAEKRIECPACGIDNAKAARQCRLCGASLLKAEPKYIPLDRTDFYAAARHNRRLTIILCALLMMVLGIFGYLIGWAVDAWQIGTDSPEADYSIWFVSNFGLTAMVIAWILGTIWVMVALIAGDRIVVAINRGIEVGADEERQLHNVVEEMAIAAGVPKPKIYIIETPAMNAFATGMQTDRSAIGVTRGLLDNLNREELQGVIAHEMGHILNLDIRYATAVGVVVGLVVLISDIALRFFRFGGRSRSRGRGGSNGFFIIVIILLVFAVLAPIAAKLVQMAISRQREFLADATSARLTRNPHGLISALKKLTQQNVPMETASKATQHLYIVNPFKAFGDRSIALMSTHPPAERRIQRLMRLGQ